MARSHTLQAVVIASAAGAALWFVTSILNGSREAWDGAGYWSVAYPLALLACALLGYRYPARPWRWAGVMFLAQFVAMCVRNGELGSLWPLGLALFAILSLPGVAAAVVAARFNPAAVRANERK